MAGGLFDPLGTDRPDRPAPRRPAALVMVAVMLVGLGLLFVVAWLRDDGDRGRPIAVAPIGRAEAPPAQAPQAQAPPSLPAPPAAEPGLPPIRADQEVEVQNGVRIVRPRRSAPAASGSTVVVPPAR